MCTAVSYRNGDHYFGRNLDLEYSYQVTVTITPRNVPFAFRKAGKLDKHYAMIGMACVAQGYPLYYEATNEKGLSMAGLNFPGNAVYMPLEKEKDKNRDSIAPFELIPWLLGQCASTAEARKALERICLVDIAFSKQLPLSPLHWLVADKECALTVECTQSGMRIYENPVGVLTNNPPFEYHMLRLADFMNVTSQVPVNRFSDEVHLQPYSLGMGGMGLPGDLSSSSRFVRAVFTKLNSHAQATEAESVSQFFHILGAVEQPRGCTQVRGKEYEYTLYSCCCNTDRGIYYYKTYDNSQLTAVELHREHLDGNQLITYPLVKGQQVFRQN